jgi:hypothetical protein
MESADWSRTLRVEPTHRRTKNVETQAVQRQGVDLRSVRNLFVAALRNLALPNSLVRMRCRLRRCSKTEARLCKHCPAKNHRLARAPGMCDYRLARRLAWPLKSFKAAGRGMAAFATLAEHCPPGPIYGMTSDIDP